MIRMFTLSIAQLGDYRTLRIVAFSLLAAAAIYVGGIALAFWGISALVDATGWTWAASLLAAAGGLAAALLGALFYPGLVTVVAGLFSESLCRAVELRHFPDLPPPREQSVPEILRGTLSFTILAVGLNLLALPLYLLFPGVNVFVFCALNGYLVSVEYFELAALRRLTPAQTKRLRKAVFLRLWGAGAVFAAAMAVPGINLVAPIVATAFMVHMLESARGRFPELALSPPGR